MSNWIRVEAEVPQQAVGDAYYINLANIAAVHLFTEFDEHGHHPRPAVSLITTGGAVVKVHGEGARDELRLALDRRALEPGDDATGGRVLPVHLG